MSAIFAGLSKEIYTVASINRMTPMSTGRENMCIFPTGNVPKVISVAFCRITGSRKNGRIYPVSYTHLKLAFFRVYSGTLASGSYVYNSTKGKKERIGRILQMHANKREDIEMVYSGDIAAAVGLKVTTTGDTLCDEKREIILESMEFPDPVIEIAIEPKTKAGQEKMGIALAKLAEEDPTFKTYTNEDTGQTIIAGMGELHLEIIVDRLLSCLLYTSRCV